MNSLAPRRFVQGTREQVPRGVHSGLFHCPLDRSQVASEFIHSSELVRTRPNHPDHYDHSRLFDYHPPTKFYGLVHCIGDVCETGQYFIPLLFHGSDQWGRYRSKQRDILDQLGLPLFLDLHKVNPSDSPALPIFIEGVNFHFEAHIVSFQASLFHMPYPYAGTFFSPAAFLLLSALNSSKFRIINRSGTGSLGTT